VDLFRQSVEWIRENKTGLKAVAVGVGVLTTAYGIYMAQSKMVLVYEALKKTAFFQTAIAEGGLVAVQNALNASMLANPIVWVVAGLAALAAGFYYAWEKSETFRAGVMGVWEVVKTYVGLMVDYWTGLWHVVHGAFTLDKGEVEKGLLTIKDTIFNAGEKLGTAWETGKEKGVASFKDSKKEKKKGDGLIAGVAPMGSPEAAAASAGAPKAPKAPSAQANKAITINVTIGKLIETFKIQTNNMSESTSKIKEMVASTLTDALNDSQIVAGI
jgi:phage-related protein